MSESSQHPQTDLVLSLIQGTEGEEWASKRLGWNRDDTTPLCSWDCISCDEEGKVSAIHIDCKPHDELHGTLPPELGSIETLRDFSIYDCDFYGTIPEEVGSLSRLETFLAGYNSLDGTVPDFTSGWLTGLWLENNMLTGKIPYMGFEDDLSLRTISLAHNQFTGTIPKSFGHIESLEMLELSDNLLSGTIPSDLKTLDFMTLSHNQFVGQIPFGICHKFDEHFILEGNENLHSCSERAGAINTVRTAGAWFSDGFADSTYVVGVVLLLLAILFAMILCRKRQRRWMRPRMLSFKKQKNDTLFGCGADKLFEYGVESQTNNPMPRKQQQQQQQQQAQRRPEESAAKAASSWSALADRVSSRRPVVGSPASRIEKSHGGGDSDDKNDDGNEEVWFVPIPKKVDKTGSVVSLNDGEEIWDLKMPAEDTKMKKKNKG